MIAVDDDDDAWSVAPKPLWSLFIFFLQPGFPVTVAIFPMLRPLPSPPPFFVFPLRVSSCVLLSPVAVS